MIANTASVVKQENRAQRDALARDQLRVIVENDHDDYAQIGAQQVRERFLAPDMGQEFAHRIAEAAEAAEQAFWAVIAHRFPEVKTGDFAPDAHARRERANLDALEHWLSGNWPNFCQNSLEPHYPKE